MVELCQNILYHMMFGIDDIDHLKTYGPILDCPSGTSSFVAESNNNYGSIFLKPQCKSHSTMIDVW